MLCTNCSQNMRLTAIGSCEACGGMTSSISYKICKQCSGKLNQCQECRIDLATPKHVVLPPGQLPSGGLAPICFVDLDNPPKSIKLWMGQELVLYRVQLFGQPFLSNLNVPTSELTMSTKMAMGPFPVLPGQPTGTDTLWYGHATARGAGKVGFMISPPAPGYCGTPQDFDYVVS